MYCIIDIYIVQENYKNEKGSKENMANIKSKLEQYRSLVEESIEVDIKIKNIKREIDELKALGEVYADVDLDAIRANCHRWKWWDTAFYD